MNVCIFNGSTFSGFFNRFLDWIWWSIPYTPFLSLDSVMGEFGTTIQFFLYLAENLFHFLSGIRMQLHVVLMLVIPFEDFLLIPFRPTECPPITNHLKNIIDWHLYENLALFWIVVNQHPMLPVMRISMEMHQPGFSVFLNHFERPIAAVEVSVVCLVFVRLRL